MLISDRKQNPLYMRMELKRLATGFRALSTLHPEAAGRQMAGNCCRTTETLASSLCLPRMASNQASIRSGIASQLDALRCSERSLAGWKNSDSTDVTIKAAW